MTPKTSRMNLNFIISNNSNNNLNNIKNINSNKKHINYHNIINGDYKNNVFINSKGKLKYPQ